VTRCKGKQERCLILCFFLSDLAGLLPVLFSYLQLAVVRVASHFSSAQFRFLVEKLKNKKNNKQKN